MKNAQTNIYKQAERFANLTKAMIMKGNIARAKKCFDVAESILKQGNKQTQNAIINVFLASVSTFMEVHHCTIRNLLPQTLHKEYVRQINSSGI